MDPGARARVSEEHRSGRYRTSCRAPDTSRLPVVERPGEHHNPSLAEVGASAPTVRRGVWMDGLNLVAIVAALILAEAPAWSASETPVGKGSEPAAVGRPDFAVPPERDLRDGECVTGSGCLNFFQNYPSGTFSTGSSSWTTVARDIWAGDYAYYSVTSGEDYEWTLCSVDGANAPYDSQLTLWDQSGTTPYCYSDDFCGDDAKIRWTATLTGTVRVLVSEFDCQINIDDTTLRWRCTSAVQPGACCVHSACTPGLTDVECAALGGVFQGSGTTCTPHPCPVCPGDANCDGAINFNDINYFVAALAGGEPGWTAYYTGENGAAPPCTYANCDANQDTVVSFDDINPFVDLLVNPLACP